MHWFVKVQAHATQSLPRESRQLFVIALDMQLIFPPHTVHEYCQFLGSFVGGLGSGQRQGHSATGLTLSSWIEVFRKSIPTFQRQAAADASVEDAQEKAGAFADHFNKLLDALLAAPNEPLPGYRAPPINCLTLCDVREQCLREAGFGDIFKCMKQEENKKALDLLPSILAELDALPSLESRLEMALRNVFAGNIFDMGAAASAERYASSQGGGALFAEARAALLPRPWAMDHMDTFVQAFLARVSPSHQVQAFPSNADDNSAACSSSSATAQPEQDALYGSTQPTMYKKAVLFVDNAGPDVVLGMLPLARLLLQAGVGRVLVAANEEHSINDITAAELKEEVMVSPQVQADSALHSALQSGRLAVISSGNALPVIDLTMVSPQCAEECEDAELVVLEGMGRAIETNLHARLTCDVLNLGMVKHPEVALELGGRMYDCVCRYAKGTKC